MSDERKNTGESETRVFPTSERFGSYKKFAAGEGHGSFYEKVYGAWVARAQQPGFIGQGEIKVKTQGKDYRFMLDTSKEIFAQYIQIFNQALPGRVFVK